MMHCRYRMLTMGLRLGIELPQPCKDQEHKLWERKVIMEGLLGL